MVGNGISDPIVFKFISIILSFAFGFSPEASAVKYKFAAELVTRATFKYSFLLTVSILKIL